tara:strand:+ start:17329 stop:18690 length:1362 start_codon:yes stop_codon:yes gene_type:complete
MEEIPVNRLLVILMTSLALALSGCLGGGGGPSSNLPAPEGPTAQVRVLHASAGAPNVDIYVNGDLGIPNLPFGEGTAFIPLPASALEIDIRAAGAAADSDPVFSTVVTPTEGDFFTLVAYGVIGSQATPLDLLVIPDQIQTPADGFTRLFVLHGAPAVGPVDVYTNTGDDLAATPTVQNFLPGTDTSDYLEIPEGTYRIRITPTGSSEVAYDSGELTLGGGLSYFAAALDRPSGIAPASVVALVGDPAFVALEDNRVQIRAVHLAPDAPQVEVLVNGAGTGVELAFTEFSDYLVVQAGTYDLAVAIPGTTTPVAGQVFTLEAEAGQSYSALATGLLTPATAAQDFTLRGLADDTTPASGNDVKVRVIHAAPDAPNVDVLANGAILQPLENVPYFTASSYLTVPAGNYDLEVNVTGTTDTVIDLPATALSAGSIYTVIATDVLPAPLTPVLIVD